MTNEVTRTLTAEGEAAVAAAELEYRTKMRAAKDVYNAAREAAQRQDDPEQAEADTKAAFEAISYADFRAQDAQRAAIAAAWEQFGVDAD